MEHRRREIIAAAKDAIAIIAALIFAAILV